MAQATFCCRHEMARQEVARLGDDQKQAVAKLHRATAERVEQTPEPGTSNGMERNNLAWLWRFVPPSTLSQRHALHNGGLNDLVGSQLGPSPEWAQGPKGQGVAQTNA